MLLSPVSFYLNPKPKAEKSHTVPVLWKRNYNKDTAVFGASKTKALQKQIISNIKSYYDEIDQKDITKVMERFSDNAVYERSGWPRLENKAQIEDFFRNKRTLSGVHHIETIRYIPAGQLHPDKPYLKLDKPAVFVTGKFNGENKGAKIENLEWTDLWFFKNDKVIYRKSTIKTPGI